MADNKDPLGILSEQKQTKDPLGILSEEPVKKKELALPSTDFSAASQFLQEKPTSTQIPFRPGVEVDQPKLKVNRVNVIKRADAGEVNPDIKELSELLQKPLPYQQQNLPDFNLNKPLPKIDKRDIDDFVVNSRVVRDLREKSIQKSKALESGINKIEQQGKSLIQQYEQTQSPELKSQIEQLNKDYQLTLKEYNRERFIQDAYEKRLLQVSDSIKQLANDKVPDNFFTGFFQRLKDNPAEFDEYVELFQKSKAEQIQFAKDAYLKMPTKEVEWYSPGGAGQIAGDITVDGLIALGASLGGTPALGIATIAGKFGAIQAGQDFIRSFNQAKGQGIETKELDKNGKPIIRIPTDDEAYDIAIKSAGVGFGTGTIEGLALGLSGGAYRVASRTAGKILPKAAAKAVGVGAAGAQEAVISGTMKTGRNVFDQYQGLQTKTFEGVPETMISRAALGSVMAIPKTFKDIKYSEQEPYYSEYVDLGSTKTSEKAKLQIFESVVNAKDNPVELKKLSENLEVIKNQGLATESEYKDMVKKAQQYQEILPTIEDVKNKKSAADLIIERKDLQEKLQTVDEAYKKPIEERIKQINEELLKVDEKPVKSLLSVEKPITEITYNFEKNKPENISKFEYYTREENGVTKYFKKEKPAEEPKPTTEDLTPTIIVNGKEYSGTNHGEAMDNAIAKGENIPDWRTPEGEVWRQENGLFKEKDGNLLTRDESDQKYGISRSEQLTQKETDKVKPGSTLFSEPVEDIKILFEKYKNKNNINVSNAENIYKIDKEQSKSISEEYDKMEHNPNDPDVKAAYEAMANETMDQYNMLKDGGYVVEIYEGEGEPYANSQEMIKDLRENKHLYVLSTEKEFGQGKITDVQRNENPLLRDSGIKDKNGKPLLINDIFRFVHDITHGERGSSFGAIGEENAWNVHARMYSPLARRAMTTETRGQNSWVNFSGQNENVFNKFKEANKLQKEGRIEEANKLRTEARKEMKFAEQKIGLLPEWVSELPEEKLQTISVENAPEGNYLNIGMLEYDTDVKMSKEFILSKIPKSAMVLEVNEREGTEPSLSIKLSRPLSNGEMKTLLTQAKQFAIPQLINGEGTIHGSKQWGEFESQYFVMPDGERLSYTVRKKDITSPIIKRISRVIDKPIQVLSKSDFAKALSEAINTGKVKLQAWGGFEKKGFEESPEWKKLIENGTVKLNFDINSIEGKPVVVINPDNMLTGEIITKDGKPIVNGNGGINFVTKFGDVWASSDEATANTLARYINETRQKDLDAGGDGTVHIVVTKGDLSKSLTSHTGAKAAMKVLEHLVDKKLVSLSDFRKSLIEVGRKYNIDFNGKLDAKSISDDISKKFFGVTDSSFKERGLFVEDIINNLSKNSKSAKENIVQIRELLNTGKLPISTERKTGEISFAKEGIIDAIGHLLSDNITVGVKNSEAYATIEIKNSVEVFNLDKEQGGHESYPFHIRQIDKSGNKVTPILNVLDKPNHVTDILNNSSNKPVEKKGGAGKFGSNQIGMAKGYVKPSSEMPKNTVKLMAKAKANKINGTYYEPHMTETKDGKNYVFFHVSSADEASIRKGIDSTKYYSIRTSRAEKGLQYGVASFYTKQNDGERMVSGEKYAVVVPKDKVYPIDLDPNGYRAMAEKSTPKNTPFREDAIKRKMSDMAKKDGYQMIVAEWYYDRKTGESGEFPSMRADALVALKPEQGIGKYKTNEDKEIYHPERQDEIIAEELNKFLEDAGSYLSEKGKFEDAYDLIENYRIYGGIPNNEEFQTIVSELPKKLRNKADSIRNKVNLQTNQLGDFYGFELNGQIYLNDELMNPNTPIHEAGHIWIDWAENERPDLLDQGMKKVEGSTYLDEVKQNPFYQQEANKLSEEDRESYYKKEALAKAIGDNGEKFATETEKKSFKEWLISMWRKIIGFFGIKNMTPEELSNLTLDEFSRLVAADIFEGIKYKEYTPKEEIKSGYIKPKVAGVAEEVTTVNETTIEMIIDETGKQKYKNKGEAMLDYEKNKLSQFGETFEEYLQRIFCP